jgi:hypothetical protein
MPALAILAAIVTAAPSPLPAAVCGPAQVIQTRSTAPLRPRKLGDLPDGYLMKAVLLKVGPCSMKIIREPAGLAYGVWRYEPDGPAAARPTPTTAPSGR